MPTDAQATIIDGRLVAAGLRGQIARQVSDFHARHGRRPMLATVLVGDDPASQVYIAGKIRACDEVGILSLHHDLPTATGQEELLALIAQLAQDPNVDGILVQSPLPAQIDPQAVIEAIPPERDVDCFHPYNLGRLAAGNPQLLPCTPAGIMHLLADCGVDLRGADAVIVGRSNMVGKPTATLLSAADATVTLCHSRTRDLAAHTRRADVLVVAVGRPRTVTADMVRPGAVVIDVGVNRTADGLVGDVDYDGVRAVAGAITPVPGGVGPMTVAMLLRNTLAAADLRMGRAAV